MTARITGGDEQVVLAELGHPVLQYNARTFDLPEEYFQNVQESNRRYARPRSGYVHPLYGPDDEELTLDWSLDHPHHRGIYWAWPEVQFANQMGDLHALQVVYSRPVGDPKLTSTDDFARVKAHNLWLWEDETPIVFESVTITVYAAAANGSRSIDFELRFEALVDGVTLARRDTDTYGGLNTRLAPVKNIEFKRHADPDGAKPQRAWSLARGTWQGGSNAATLAILEHPQNRDYPGDWITYEYLPWFQPAFPKAGTRHALHRDQPLVLRYRFLVIPGQANDESLNKAFDAYVQSTLSKLESNSEREVE
ncbi:MAG: PmoA family protein [Phycisphaerales bacterium]|nr:PmoA family protein [Phycisphaerales bacterium]